jgi:adenylate kinase family enzyme
MEATATLREQGLSIGVIPMGDIFREMLKTDPAFAAKYRGPMKAGDLIDDSKTIETFELGLTGLVRDGPPNIIIVDGFCRTPVQVKYSISNGFAQKKDRVLIFNAPFKICLDRFIHRKGLSEERLETEIPTFEKRYHLHEAIVPALRRCFLEAQVPVNDVDAKDAIASHVFPKVLNYLNPLIVEIAARRLAKERIPASF